MWGIEPGTLPAPSGIIVSSFREDSALFVFETYARSVAAGNLRAVYAVYAVFYAVYAVFYAVYAVMVMIVAIICVSIIIMTMIMITIMLMT